MAVLGATSLTGCDSIPSFIGGGSKTVFWMATSPVSWTKDTTVNEGMLRVVNGASLSPGGSLTFSQVFASNKPITATIQQNTIAVTQTNTSFAYPVSPFNLSQESGPSSTPASLPESQFTAHYHSYIYSDSGAALTVGTANATVTTFTPSTTAQVGGNQSHFHTIQQHNHSVSTSSQVSHSHTITGQHSHPLTSTSEYNVSYVDMIICTKN